MIQTLFVKNKQTIVVSMHVLNINFALVFNIILWEETRQDYLVLRPACIIWRSNSDVIYLVVLTLGSRVVLFSSEVDVVSKNNPLSWLSSTISSELWVFGGPHGTKYDFPWRMISIPQPTLPSELWLEWWIFNTINIFQPVLISNGLFQLVHQQTPLPPPHLLNFHCHRMKNDLLWLLIIYP